jgi:hypothetical protein
MVGAFETMSPEEVFAILRECRSAVFTARRSSIGFQQIERLLPDTDLTELFAIPPSFIVTRQSITQAFEYKDSDRFAVWVRFFSLAFIYHGQIVFRKLDRDQFEVRVSFPVPGPPLM